MNLRVRVISGELSIPELVWPDASRCDDGTDSRVVRPRWCEQAVIGARSLSMSVPVHMPKRATDYSDFHHHVYRAESNNN